MTSTINTRNQLGLSSLPQQRGPQDPVHLARTLRRIKRRLLLEQCGVSLPQTLQNTTPHVLSRPCDGALPYALQTKPQVLLRSDSGDSAECTMKVGTSKNPSSIGRVLVLSEVTLASPSME